MYFSSGYIESVYGPTLLDLQAKLGVSLRVMSTFLFLRSVGFISGCIVGGLISKASSKEPHLVISLIAQAFFLSTLPYIKSVWLFYTIAALIGFILGFIETSINGYILSLWSNAPKVLFQLANAFCGLGTYLAPLIAEYFLSKEVDSVNLNEAKRKNQSENFNVQWPYEIIAIFMFIVAIVFALICFLYRENREINQDQENLEAEENSPNMLQGLHLFIGFFASVILILFGTRCEIALWLGVSTFGLGLSSIFGLLLEYSRIKILSVLINEKHSPVILSIFHLYGLKKS
ncbi:sodium-dependent glucose transporter 1-like protein [Dinothrombium tinctorium]|uniref:Sodium-dependent glucose transporter 1-like protein n=1 Tax=Dinothrombium tinctorium TaxID=1965070 RepID=A0A3S3NQQ6_9ACAR|nr:sodium-dependent glucose transporter 1-like protein [Dinothrombium tinctorium]